VISMKLFREINSEKKNERIYIKSGPSNLNKIPLDYLELQLTS
jgi:hypothetical protein